MDIYRKESPRDGLLWRPVGARVRETCIDNMLSFKVVSLPTRCTCLKAVKQHSNPDQKTKKVFPSGARVSTSSFYSFTYYSALRF